MTPDTAPPEPAGESVNEFEGAPGAGVPGDAPGETGPIRAGSRKSRPARSTAWVRKNPQTENNAKEMAAARDLAERRKRYDPISVKEFAAQEGLSVTDTRRKLALASLPARAQTLVEERRLAIMSAEHIAAARHLAPHEKTAVAEKIAAGTLSREAVRDCVKALAEWSPETRTAFLTDPNLTFEEAQERFWQDKRVGRERAVAEERQRRALRDKSREPQWVALTAVNQFNQATLDIAERPERVEPTLRTYAAEILLDALGNGAVALQALGRRGDLRDKLAGLLSDVEDRQLAAPSPVVTGSIVDPIVDPDGDPDGDGDGDGDGDDAARAVT